MHLEGQRMDLHAGAAGKIILAYSPEEMVDAVLAKTGLPKRTAATITGKNRLLKELDHIGTGTPSASASVLRMSVLNGTRFEHGHELVGALSISGPISRFTPDPQITQGFCWLPALNSRQLGWVPPGIMGRAAAGNDQEELRMTAEKAAGIWCWNSATR
jgi:hypothetical protein